MTLKEWYDFNKEVLSSSNFIVCLLNKTYKRDDTILEAEVNGDFAVQLFGECELKRIQIAALHENDFKKLRLLLWPKTEITEEVIKNENRC